MAELLFYPVLLLLTIIESAIIRNLPLFNGTADLLILWLAAWGLHNKGKHVWVGAIFTALIMSFVSAVPLYAYLITYLFVAFLSRYMNRHFWHNPMIALILVVFFSSIVSGVTQFAALYIQGSSMQILTAVKYVMIPSVFLNLLFAIPIYALVNDMALWVYPVEVDE
jgi:cell shape-determining protein MreD